jgi:hypothetical protein
MVPLSTGDLIVEVEPPQRALSAIVQCTTAVKPSGLTEMTEILGRWLHHWHFQLEEPTPTMGNQNSGTMVKLPLCSGAFQCWTSPAITRINVVELLNPKMRSLLKSLFKCQV